MKINAFAGTVSLGGVERAIGWDGSVLSIQVSSFSELSAVCTVLEAIEPSGVLDVGGSSPAHEYEPPKEAKKDDPNAPPKERKPRATKTAPDPEPKAPPAAEKPVPAAPKVEPVGSPAQAPETAASQEQQSQAQLPLPQVEPPMFTEEVPERTPLVSNVRANGGAPKPATLATIVAGEVDSSPELTSAKRLVDVITYFQGKGAKTVDEITVQCIANRDNVPALSRVVGDMRERVERALGALGQ